MEWVTTKNPRIKSPGDKLFDYRSKRKKPSKEDLEVQEAHKILEDQIDNED